MTFTANITRKSSAAHRLSAGQLTARLSKPLPVKAAVEIDVDVAVVADDIITVSEGTEGTSINMFFLSDISNWGNTDPDVVMSTIRRHRPDRINLYIGSNGGEAIVANRIYDILRSSGAEITVYLTGICASAATMIACAGDRVIMSRQCLYMTHSGGIFAGFLDGDNISEYSGMLSAVNSIITDIYSRKTGRSKEEMQQYVTGETWLDADEALAAGFVDEVVDAIEIDMDLPGDVKEYYCSYYDDDHWYTFFDMATGKMKDEQTVFTACLEHAKNNGQLTSRAQPANSATNESEKDMKLIDALIDKLATAGYIKKDQAQAAKNDLTDQSSELLASLAKEVKAQMEAEAPPAGEAVTDTEAPKTLSDQIGEMTDKDVAALGQRLSALSPEGEELEAEPSEEVAELTAQVKDLTGELQAVKEAISASRAGRPAAKNAAPPASNGVSDVETISADGVKEPKDGARYATMLNSYRAGNISAELFKKLTGHDAPKQ